MLERPCHPDELRVAFRAQLQALVALRIIFFPKFNWIELETGRPRHDGVSPNGY
jgi:hypothetical protein